MNSEFSDFIVYADESGSPIYGADRKDFPIFVLVFLLVRKVHYIENLVPEIQRLKFDFVGYDQLILHERDIRRQSGEFAFLQVSQDIRERFMDRINRIIDAFPVNQQAQVRVQLSVALICVLSQVLLRRDDRPGRVAAYEFLVVTPAISNLIRENKTFRIDSAIQTGKKFGMQLLDDHLWSLYEKGVIPADEMIDKGKDPGELTEKVHRAGDRTRAV